MKRVFTSERCWHCHRKIRVGYIKPIKVQGREFKAHQKCIDRAETRDRQGDHTKV